MKILIVGYGYVGEALASELVDAGYKVVAVRRSELTQPLHRGIEFRQADATRSDHLARLPDDIDQIVCAVAPDGRTEAHYRSAYPDLVSALTSRFPHARLLLVSSTAVYEQSQAEVVDDHAPAAATSETAAQIKCAEDYLLDHARSDAEPLRETLSLHPVVIRASGIYGPGRTRLIAALAHYDLDPEDQSTWTSRVHRDDLASIIAFLIKRPNLRGVFNASDPNPCQLKELSAWAKTHVDKSLLAGASPPSRNRKSRRIMPQRLINLGYRFRYPRFSDGYQHILDQLNIR